MNGLKWKILLKNTNILEFLNRLSSKRTENYGNLYKSFAVFGIFNYPLSYLYHLYGTYGVSYESFTLRFFSTILCIILLYNKSWPKKLQIFLPLYWHFTVLFCLLFIGSYLLLKNHFSYNWLMNIALGLFLLILLVDWISFIFIMSLGSLLGTSLFIASGQLVYFEVDSSNLNFAIYMYFFVIIIGSFFSRNKEIITIEKTNYQLKQKVRERTSDLQHALFAKTEFLNNMSHEIRTPVQGITAISKGLIDHWNSCSEDERKFYARKVAENSNRLFSLVSNLLDLAECNSGSLELNLVEDDLIDLVNAMIDESKDLYIRDKEIELQFETTLSSAPLICDHERILQVLRNIFANAIKFTSKGKIIATLTECALTYDNGETETGYHFSLSDEGIGIPAGEEESIFDPFTQSTRTKTRAGGTGLGLAICKDIIKAHMGRIWAKNNDRVGTTIYFDIPAKQSKIKGNVCIASSLSDKLLDTQSNSQNNVVNLEKEYIDNIDISKDTPVNSIQDKHLSNSSLDNSSSIEEKETANTETRTKLDKEEKTILLIDDEEAAHISMRLILKDTSYNLITANGGIDGLAVMQKHHNEIDLVLLDLMMPDMYGLNVLAAMREDKDMHKLPVILQTGSSDMGELARARSLGALNHILKPYNKDLILNMITEIIG